MKKLITISILFISLSIQAQWDYNINGTGVQTATNSAKGSRSTAMGKSTTAFGNYSTAMGIATTTMDLGTLTLGAFNTDDPTPNPFVFDLSNRALVIGNGTVTNQSDALIVLFDGTTTIAGSVTAPSFIGDGSLLTNMPWSINANGTGVETATNTASGWFSTVMGRDNNASGQVSTAMGGSNIASGGASLAMGANNIASANNSIAMGFATTSSGLNATAMGSFTTSSGWNSTVMGRKTSASDYGSLAMGTYNTIQTTNATAFDLANRALVIGNGTSGNRSDALTILFDGTTTIAGNVTAPFFIGDGSQLTNVGTDDQALTLNTNSLDLEDGGSVDLSGYLDNTDDQNISGSGLAGTTLTIGIEGGTSEDIDLSSLDNSGTDDQVLSLNSNSLDLEDGGSVDLSGYLDNTDSQNIAAFEFVTSSNLKIEIENGNVMSADLSPLLSNLEAENAAQQAQIDAQQALIEDLIARMEVREQCECTPLLGVSDFNLTRNQAYLSQNVPNPFDYTTTVGYFIPLSYSKANIVVSTTTGQILKNINITKFGEGSIEINKERMATALYYYTLYVDGKKVDTKRMIVE